MDSDAGRNFVARDDVWKIENRGRAHADHRHQRKWNEELEKHDSRTKNTTVEGLGSGLVRTLCWYVCFMCEQKA